MVVAYVMRFIIEDRRRRRVQNAFGHYLAPAIVDQLTDSEARFTSAARSVMSQSCLPTFPASPPFPAGSARPN